MKTIWKYELPFAQNAYGLCEIAMPKGAKILSAQNQNDKICIWAEVESDINCPTEIRCINTYGTGKRVDKNPGTFLGIVQINQFIWHVYVLI